MSDKQKKAGPLPLILFIVIAFGLSLGAWVVFYFIADQTPVEHIERGTSPEESPQNPAT